MSVSESGTVSKSPSGDVSQQNHHQQQHQQWLKQHSLEATVLNVKFAGEQARDRLYEAKHKRKVIRVLTVIGYVFTVSLAAIMLSLYYVFFYPKLQKTKHVNNLDGIQLFYFDISSFFTNKITNNRIEIHFLYLPNY